MTLFFSNLVARWREWRQRRRAWREGSGVNVIAEIARLGR